MKSKLNKFKSPVICFLFFHFTCDAQKAGFPIYLESGLTFNFLRTIPQNYPDSTDRKSTLEIDKLKPLSGFVIGVVPQVTINGGCFYKVGVVFSYLVSSAEINSRNEISGILYATSTNIKTRFRNLYVQFPVAFGYSFGRRKIFSAFGGVRLSLPVLDRSFTEQSSIFYSTYFEPDTFTYTTTLDTHSEDIAAEIGFTQRLSDVFILEERIYRGFTIISEFTDGRRSPALKQTTFELTFGWKLPARKKENVGLISGERKSARVLL
jgi:hypothetical protein